MTSHHLSGCSRIDEQQLDLFGVSPHQNRRKKNFSRASPSAWYSHGEFPLYVFIIFGCIFTCMEWNFKETVTWFGKNKICQLVLLFSFTFLCAKQTPTFCNFMMRSRLRLLHFIAAILFLSRLFLIVAGSSCFGVYEKRKLSLILKFCKNIPLVSWKTVILAPILWWMELLA